MHTREQSLIGVLEPMMPVLDCRLAVRSPRRLTSCRYTLSPILAVTSLLYSDAGRMLAATSFVE